MNNQLENGNVLKINKISNEILLKLNGLTYTEIKSVLGKVMVYLENDIPIKFESDLPLNEQK